MRTHKITATLPEDHRLSLELPDDFPPGPVEVTVEAGGVDSEASPKGTLGSELLVFAGTLDEMEARRMEAAIEEGCERVDPRDW